MMNFFRKYESIYGVLIGVIPSFSFAIIPADTNVKFSIFLIIITFLLLIIWFLGASYSRAMINCDSINNKLTEAEKRKNIELTVTHLDLNSNKMKFVCNAKTNVLSKDLCVTIYNVKNELKTPCGIGRITEYDSEKKIAQAKIILVPIEGDVIDTLSIENIHLSPMVDYDMINAVVLDLRRSEDV